MYVVCILKRDVRYEYTSWIMVIYVRCYRTKSNYSLKTQKPSAMHALISFWKKNITEEKNENLHVSSDVWNVHFELEIYGNFMVRIAPRNLLRKKGESVYFLHAIEFVESCGCCGFLNNITFAKTNKVL